MIKLSRRKPRDCDRMKGGRAAEYLAEGSLYETGGLISPRSEQISSVYCDVHGISDKSLLYDRLNSHNVMWIDDKSENLQ